MNIYHQIQENHNRSKVRHWLKVQQSDLLLLLRENYAQFIGCPVDEVCAFDEFEDSALLNFVYANLGKDVDAYCLHHPIPA